MVYKIQIYITCIAQRYFTQFNINSPSFNKRKKKQEERDSLKVIPQKLIIIHFTPIYLIATVCASSLQKCFYRRYGS